MARSQVEPHRRVVRARLILLLVEGASVSGAGRSVGLARRIVLKWEKRFLACELPDDVDRSLSLWTCAELARTAVRDKVVDAISGSARR